MRRTSERRDHGRHWPGRLVPLKSTTEATPALAARCDGPESAPMNRSARSSRAAVWVKESRPVQSCRSARGWSTAAASASSGPPTTITRQPSSRNRAIRAFQWPGGHRLAAVPAPRWTTRSGAEAPNRPACSQSASSERSGAGRGAIVLARAPDGRAVA